MNINDFMITVTISLSIGLLCGFFLRDLVRLGLRVYKRYLRRPKYIQRVIFDDIDTNNTHSNRNETDL